MKFFCHSRESGNLALHIYAAYQSYDAMTRFWIPTCAGMGLLFLLSACGTSPEHDKWALTQVDFKDLPGWTDDHQSAALPALSKSCENKTTPACAALKDVPVNDDNAMRGYLLHWFKAYAVEGEDGDKGLFTGYYEASLNGSYKKTTRFYIPLYARPRDLVTADLGAFNPELKGKKLMGKVEDQKLVPYDSRDAIDGGSLKGRAKVLLWVDDPVDAFFLQVQGSGRVTMTDKSVVHVGYDDANGRSYIAIGRILSLMKKIEKPVTMDKIRQYLTQHPGDANEIMNLNASYVFFKVIEGEGPLGAEGVALTPKRSLAVDHAFIKLGTPLWLDTKDADGAPLQRLMVAQDTGGAIKGAVRGDFFWGYGDDAALKAGAMQSRGRYYVLLPRDADAK